MTSPRTPDGGTDTPPSRRRFLAVVAGGGAAAAFLFSSAGEARESPSPTRDEIKALVIREARSLGVPVSLALAVAEAESAFAPDAESPKGARGVMQVMPATARGEYGIHPDRLWDARINVRVGLHFLKRLIDQYRGRTDLALSWYNGGSAVGDLPYARVIPATRPYIRRVYALQSRYRRELFGYPPPEREQSQWTISKRP